MNAFRRLLPPGRLLQGGASAIGVAFAAIAYSRAWPPGFDAYAYWSVDPAHPYVHRVSELGAFTYSPAAALVFGFTKLVPFALFEAAWFGLAIAVLLWLGRGYGLALLLFPPVLAEVFAGNIHLLVAVAIIVGFRYPAAWAVILLTKVTPGIGLLWFAVRGEWRSLGIALGVTGTIAAASFILAPGVWAEWFAFLGSGLDAQYGWPVAIALPLAPRLVAAALLVTWGARRNARWTVPLAAALALPVLWISGLAILAGIPQLLPDRRGPGRRPAR